MVLTNRKPLIVALLLMVLAAGAITGCGTGTTGSSSSATVTPVSGNVPSPEGTASGAQDVPNGVATGAVPAKAGTPGPVSTGAPSLTPTTSSK